MPSAAMSAVDDRRLARGDLCVRAVHGGLVRHPAGPERGRALAAERPHPVLPSRADRVHHPVGTRVQPADMLGRIVRDPAIGHAAERDELGRAGADDLRGPAMGPAHMRGQLPQGPVRAGRHRTGQVGAVDQLGNDLGAGRQFRVMAFSRKQRSLPGHRQPHAPPQQPPPPPPRDWAAPARPPTDTVDSSLTVSSCPFGHRHGAEDSLIGRLRSNVDPHARHRYS